MRNIYMTTNKARYVFLDLKSLRFLAMNILLIIFISGCSSSNDRGKDFEFQNDEKVYIQSKDYNQLVELYKNKIKQEEDLVTRLKLAQVYLDLNEPESALFTLKKPLEQGIKEPKVYYLQAISFYNQSEFLQAEVALNQVLKFNPNDAKAFNLLGMVHAGQHDFVQARDNFNKAREELFDDVKIKNNLAVLDLLNEDYQQAYDRLLPLYINGQADEQVKANLAICMAKLGNYQELRLMLSSKYSNKKFDQLYLSLRNLNRLDQNNEGEKPNAIIPHNDLNDLITLPTTVDSQSKMGAL